MSNLGISEVHSSHLENSAYIHFRFRETKKPEDNTIVHLAKTALLKHSTAIIAAVVCATVVGVTVVASVVAYPLVPIIAIVALSALFGTGARFSHNRLIQADFNQFHKWSEACPEEFAQFRNDLGNLTNISTSSSPLLDNFQKEHSETIEKMNTFFWECSKYKESLDQIPLEKFDDDENRLKFEPLQRQYAQMKIHQNVAQNLSGQLTKLKLFVEFQKLSEYYKKRREEAFQELTQDANCQICESHENYTKEMGDLRQLYSKCERLTSTPLEKFEESTLLDLQRYHSFILQQIKKFKIRCQRFYEGIQLQVITKDQFSLDDTFYSELKQKIQRAKSFRELSELYEKQKEALDQLKEKPYCKFFLSHESYTKKMSEFNELCGECERLTSTPPAKIEESTIVKLSAHLNHLHIKTVALKYICEMFFEGIALKVFTMDQFSCEISSAEIDELSKTLQQKKNEMLWNTIQQESRVEAASKQYIQIKHKMKLYGESVKERLCVLALFKLEKDLKDFALDCSGIMLSQTSELLEKIRDSYLSDASDVDVEETEEQIPALENLWAQAQKEQYVLQACEKYPELARQKTYLNAKVVILSRTRKKDKFALVTQITPKGTEDDIYQFILRCAGITSDINTHLLNTIREEYTEK